MDVDAPERPRTAPATQADVMSRANYTASGLGLFTIPLMGSRAAGLPGEQLANIEAATLASTMLPTSSLSALMSGQSAPAPASASQANQPASEPSPARAPSD